MRNRLKIALQNWLGIKPAVYVCRCNCHSEHHEARIRTMEERTDPGQEIVRGRILGLEIGQVAFQQELIDIRKKLEK